MDGAYATPLHSTIPDRPNDIKKRRENNKYRRYATYYSCSSDETGNRLGSGVVWCVVYRCIGVSSDYVSILSLIGSVCERVEKY